MPHPEVPSDRGEFYGAVAEWVLNAYDKDRYQRFKETLHPQLAERLENADPAEWYPVEDSRVMYERIVASFGKDSLVSFIRFYVSRAIHGFIRGLVSFIPPLGLAKRALALWNRFHSTGRPEIEMIDKNHGIITLFDWDYSPIHCKVHALWFAELIRTAGGKNPVVEHTHCVHRGDEFCRWEVGFE
ncbi:hypothetical protein GF359_03325 [candidate division WOR-3 bacterium]|uniref:4-vinyl reductase 4VR domain-containing protein n=1 Tax=candidate division WOR-3 bacterium TaxID=2052148 RepID=A0A9D5QCQ4_UNCW3|nr:hypothetical protein [candidate division WOR-3 bacterium]MBD3364226.1 hypothetical protein [candidate division WOR-3 bacterium]